MTCVVLWPLSEMDLGTMDLEGADPNPLDDFLPTVK